MSTLRRIVKDAAGQNIQRCAGCLDCDPSIPEQDVPLGSLIQMALMDDEECLTCRTLWSNEVFKKALRTCTEGLDLQKIILVLREEANRRGIV
jgi:heterodisulfide reductase subunit C